MEAALEQREIEDALRKALVAAFARLADMLRNQPEDVAIDTNSKGSA
jgi:truncated hemoglobin YjbI